MNQAFIQTDARPRALRERRGAQKSVAEVKKAGLAWPVRVLLISLFVPWTFYLGPIALSPYRLMLIIMVVPTFISWMRGKAGKIRPADITILLYACWCSLALLANHGIAGAFQPAGILVLETVGGYFISRVYVRDADTFYSAIKLLFMIVMFFLPFAILEAYTKRDYLLEMLGAVFPVPVLAGYEPRWGLKRVQGVLEHPILFGVVCGSILALTHTVLGYGESAAKRWFRTFLVAATAFLSLSAGPITAMIGQALLLSYHWVLRDFAYRWRLLLGTIASIWVAISLVSNRSVPNLYLSTFSFDTESAYYRIQIWNYGSQSALNNPLFGVGLNRWERPGWMPPSIDMFWLIHAVFYGIPAAIFMLLTFILSVSSIGLRNSSDPKLERYRTGYLVTMAGFFVVGWTVHFWNATYILFLFLLGSGFWMLDEKSAEPRRSTADLPRAPIRSPQTKRAANPGRRPARS